MPAATPKQRRKPAGGAAVAALDDAAGLDGLKAADRAYHLVRRLIISGDAPPGTHLTETRLSQATGLSRTPIRDALHQLKSQGLVVAGPNNGAAVASFSAEDVVAIREIRCLLEGYAAERAAERIAAEQLAGLERIAGAMEAMVAQPGALDRIAFADLNIAFHTTIAEAARSLHLEMLIRIVVQLPLVLMRKGEWPSLAANRLGIRHHREIIEALRSGDPQWAGAQMRAHIAASVRG